MRKASLFALVLGIALSVFIAIIIWYLEIYQSGNASMSGMMGQMMGNQNSSSPQSAMPQYVWVLIVTAIGIMILGIGGTAYYVIFPEIRPSVSLQKFKEAVSPVVARQEEYVRVKSVEGASWPALLKTSKPDEKKILEVLSAHNGSYLQKSIVKESGLTKLKTHRIISRFAGRGIVQVAKSGNTNLVTLADWLGKPKSDSR